MIKKVIRFLGVALLCVGCASEESAELARMDDALKNKGGYESYFLDKVQALKEVLTEATDSNQVYRISERISDLYSSYSYDSTVTYLTRNLEAARQMQDSEKELSSLLQLANEHVRAGYYAEAGDILFHIDQVSVPDNLLDLYYGDLWRLYGEKMAYAPNDAVHHEYAVMRDIYRDKMLSIVEKESYQWYSLMYEAALAEEDKESQTNYAWKMLELSEPLSREYATAAYFYQHSLDETDPLRLHYLIESSIVDIMLSHKDYAALTELSEFLYAQGDYTRAFRYVADHCLPDALKFNGKLRPWQIVQFFPSIEKAYEEEAKKHNDLLLSILLFSLVLAVFLIVTLIVLIRHHRALVKARDELSALNEQMKEADKIKQEYITQFLSILSDNIGETRKYKNHVLHYIRLGHTDILAKEIESLPPLSHDVEEFNRIFDNTFLNIFPGFVHGFNELLEPGEEIVPKGEGVLTPELRIYALIRLGIVDSRRIADLLHYSPNTIFNYRVKIRNKAKVGRDSFEDMVMKLQ